MKPIIVLFLLALSLPGWSQKKVLDHSVYDGWQSLGERLISSDGRTVVYTINPQEGDGVLVIERPLASAGAGTGRSADRGMDTDRGKGLGSRQEIARGYSALITADSRWVLGRIRPWFKDSREARIKKKKPEDMPKDSLFLLDLTSDILLKIGNIKSYKIPEKGNGWVAYLAEKPLPEAPGKKMAADSLTQLNELTRLADSLSRLADSLRGRAGEARLKGIAVLKEGGKRKGGAGEAGEKVEEGTVLTLRNLYTGDRKSVV